MRRDRSFLPLVFVCLLCACAAPGTLHTPPSPVALQNSRPISFHDALRDGGIGPEMAWIPPGSFMMGDLQGNGLDDEHPAHRVDIDAPFAIGQYEVTFDEYDRFCDATGRTKPDDLHWGRGRQPVILVDWFDAVAYTEWLSAQTGREYRLPTEAEWEYAARAGTQTNYWWGNAYEMDRANCYDCGSVSLAERTVPVGSFAPNPFGLYDTAGNVWEWTASQWMPRYSGAELRVVDKHEVKVVPDYVKGIQLAMRGGAFNLHPLDSRVSSRYYGAPRSQTPLHGFRVMRVYDPAHDAMRERP